MRLKVIFASVLLAVFIVASGTLIIVYDNIVYPLNYKSEIVSAGEEFSIDPVLIASVINAESRFDVEAVSEKGAVGLMQVKPSTAEWIVKEMAKENTQLKTVSVDEVNIQKIMYNDETKTGELLDPNTNIRIGAFYLAYLINKFDTLELALCAYNAGEGTVRSWLANSEYSSDGIKLDKIPYKETQNYLDKINRCLKIYERKILIK